MTIWNDVPSWDVLFRLDRKSAFCRVGAPLLSPLARPLGIAVFLVLLPTALAVGCSCPCAETPHLFLVRGRWTARCPPQAQASPPLRQAFGLAVLSLHAMPRVAIFRGAFNFCRENPRLSPFPSFSFRSHPLGRPKFGFRFLSALSGRGPLP